MAVPAQQKTSFDDFMAFIQQPEHREKIYEFIDGEIIEVPSNPFVSVIAGLILYAIQHWLHTAKHEGYVTGEGGGFIVDGQVFAPDVAYIRHLPTNTGFEQAPPELAVEVISDPHSNTEQTDLRRKLSHYQQANVVVWVVDYVAQQVEVHVPNEAMKLYDTTMTVPGGDVLPGFELPVKDIFPAEKPSEA